VTFPRIAHTFASTLPACEPLEAAPLQPRIEIVRPGRWLQIGSPSGFEWTRVELPIANLSPKLAGFRIVQVTDLHLKSRWWDAYDELHKLVNQRPPDLILCTGDFVEHKWSRKLTLPTLRRFVEGLNARLGIWGILGNHDGDLLAPHIIDFRLNLLNRARTILETNDDAIELIGTPGVHRWDLDDEFLTALPPRDPDRPRIVLQHYPDQIRRTEALGADIVFAGHTHGGQCCLPGGIPIITHDSLPRRFASGVHRFGRSWMIVGRGLGYASLPMRTFCPGQVMEILLMSC
jgi:uncharacterized protein